jgi:hypothetical protein
VSGLDKNLHYTVTHYGEVSGYGKVYVVPQSDGILSSVAQLTRNKYKLLFEENQVVIMHPDYENIYGIRNEYYHYTVNRDSMTALRSKQRSHSKSFVLGNDTCTNSRSSDKFSKEQMHKAEQEVCLLLETFTQLDACLGPA